MYKRIAYLLFYNSHIERVSLSQTVKGSLSSTMKLFAGGSVCLGDGFGAQMIDHRWHVNIHWALFHAASTAQAIVNDWCGFFGVVDERGPDGTDAVHISFAKVAGNQ